MNCLGCHDLLKIILAVTYFYCIALWKVRGRVGVWGGEGCHRLSVLFLAAVERFGCPGLQ